MAKCRFTETSLDIEPGLTLNEWLKIGHGLAKMERCLNWWIGDYFVYGENRHEWGEAWVQPAGELGITPGRAKMCYEVSKRVPRVTRVTPSEARWTIHRCVAFLESKAQMKWLNEAVKHHLTERALRYSIANGRVLTDEDCDRLSGKGSGIKGLLEGIMRDFRGWLTRETNDDPDTVEGWPIERVKVVWHELRPAYQLANKCAVILAREQKKMDAGAKPQDRAQS